MSILSNIWSDILAAIYPPRCLVCQEPINIEGSLICTKCFSSISFTRFWEYSTNSMAEHARDLQPFIHQASALLYYDSYSRDMIHRFKYYGEWHTAKYLGEIFGGYLSRSELYADIDVIVPVPLHLFRRFGRGYNQAEYIALGVASKLGCNVDFHTLYRSHYTSSQARKLKVDRWDSQDNLFQIRNSKHLEGKHMLLVDDVYTSGATIFHCAETLHHSIPNCKISIATIAVSREYD